MQPHSACYGKMFPPTLVKTDNQEVRAKVFGYMVDHTGVVETGRTVTTDLEAWDECSQCPDLDGCFRLSTGTLLMEIALKG
jgi:hypothetical protein